MLIPILSVQCTCGHSAFLAYGPEKYRQTKWALPPEKSWKAQTLLADFHCSELYAASPLLMAAKNLQVFAQTAWLQFLRGEAARGAPLPGDRPHGCAASKDRSAEPTQTLGMNHRSRSLLQVGSGEGIRLLVAKDSDLVDESHFLGSHHLAPLLERRTTAGRVV